MRAFLRKLRDAFALAATRSILKEIDQMIGRAERAEGRLLELIGQHDAYLAAEEQRYLQLKADVTAQIQKLAVEQGRTRTLRQQLQGLGR